MGTVIAYEFDVRSTADRTAAHGSRHTTRSLPVDDHGRSASVELLILYHRDNSQLDLFRRYRYLPSGRVNCITRRTSPFVGRYDREIRRGQGEACAIRMDKRSAREWRWFPPRCCAAGNTSTLFRCRAGSRTSPILSDFLSASMFRIRDPSTRIH